MDTARLIFPHRAADTSLSLTEALDRASAAVLGEWERRVRRNIPDATAGLSADELRANLPDFLSDLGPAVEGGSRDKLVEEEGPARGLRRFHQHFKLGDLLESAHHLWAALVLVLPASLARPLSADEVLRMRDVFDDFANAGVLAYASCQQAADRMAAEELKRLTFVSHDLKNTLHESVTGLALLRRRLEDRREFEGEANFVREVERAVADTVHGMQQLLEHERLRNAGVRPALQRVDVAELACRVSFLFAARLRDRGLALDLAVPPGTAVESDPDLLAIVLRNLIGNAVQYSQNGTIRVRLESGCARGHRCGGGCVACGGDATDRGGWVLSVSDEGPGIDPQTLKFIFEAFRRGAATKPAVAPPGTGLGLAIAREAAQALGAELTAESKIGIGSTFRLHLRVSPPPADR